MRATGGDSDLELGVPAVQAPAGSFVKFMRRSPLYGVELDLKREQTPTRKADIA